MDIDEKHGYSRLASMRAFLAVAETSSFSVAARKLGVTGSTISKHIESLEARMRVELLQRNTRHVHLTEAGNLYFIRMSKVIADLDHVSEEIALGTQSLSGKIRVGVSSMVGGSIIGHLLDDFSRSYPSIKSVIKISDQPFDIVRDNIAVAIVPIHWHTPNSFIRRSLCKYTLAVVSPGTRHSAEEPAKHAKAARFVITGDVNPIGNDLAHLAGIPHHNLIETNNIDLQKKMIVQLEGIGVVPTCDDESTGQQDGLQTMRRFDEDALEICLVYATRQHLPRAVRAFIDHALDFFLCRSR